LNIPDDARKLFLFWTLIIGTLFFTSALLGLAGLGAFLFCCFWSFFAAGVHFLQWRHDYSGKNRERRIRIENTFGSKYTFSYLMLGQLSVRARVGVTPTESDALELGDLLWSEAGRLRTDMLQRHIPFLDTNGKTRFYILPGTTAAGIDCIGILRVVGVLWGIWPRVEPGPNTKVPDKTNEAA
jgi:hypothetical protein